MELSFRYRLLRVCRFEGCDDDDGILTSSILRALTVLSTTNIVAIKVKQDTLPKPFYVLDFLLRFSPTDGTRKYMGETLPLATCL